MQTKKLWIDRLQREKKSIEGSSLPVPCAVPPKKLSISYPFSSSPLLQEQALPFPHCLRASGVLIMFILLKPLVCMQYRSPWSAVRIGRLLEDLDSLAGNIAYEHW